MKCFPKRHTTQSSPLQRRVLHAITLALWGGVLLGIVYYFVFVHIPQPKSIRISEWRDIPFAEVGAGEEYEKLEEYGELYALDYDSIWCYDRLLESVMLPPFEEEVVEPTNSTAAKPTETKKHLPQSAKRPGLLSEWDYLFQKYGEEYGWDWCVLASIAYQESHFRPCVIGAGGATGLMGIMPATGRRYGYSRQQLKNAEISGRIACMALRDFGLSFAHISDSEQRMKFTLASYNAGSAHILDARRLAEQAGLDPDQWDESVAQYLCLLDDPKYYRDPVVLHGRLRGDRTVRYVASVFARAQTYRMQSQYATTE